MQLFYKMKTGKVILFTIILVGIGAVVHATIKNQILLAKKDDEKKSNDKLIQSMREKYNEIKSFDDFSEGIKYVAYPEVFGYDLRLLKTLKPNLPKLITLDEAKFIYHVAQIGLGNVSNEDGNKFLDIMHKIF